MIFVCLFKFITYLFSKWTLKIRKQLTPTLHPTLNWNTSINLKRHSHWFSQIQVPHFLFRMCHIADLASWRMVVAVKTTYYDRCHHRQFFLEYFLSRKLVNDHVHTQRDVFKPSTACVCDCAVKTFATTQIDKENIITPTTITTITSSIRYGILWVILMPNQTAKAFMSTLFRSVCHKS